MRIALQSMTNGATNPMLTNQQPASATSFLSVLSTVGRPSQATNANNSGSDQRSDADAATAQQQSQDAAQDTVPAPKPGVTLAAPFTDVAGTNLTILPVGRFHAVLSTANATSPVAGKSTKDQQATGSSTAQPSNAVTDNTQPIPVPVVATDIPAATTQSLTQSIAAIPAVATATATAPAFTMPAAGNLAAQSTDRPQSSVDTTPGTTADATEQQTPSASTSVASSQPIAADAATRASEPRANKTETAPQADASAAPALPTQCTAQNTNAQQSKDTSNSDAAGKASPAATPAPVRNSNDRSFFLPAAPGVFGIQAQGANQASSDDSKTTASTDNTNASDADAAPAAQSANAAQNAAAQAALVSGVVLPAPQPLPNLNFAATTGFSLQASNKGTDGKAIDAGSTSTANGTGSTKNGSAQDSNSTPATQAQGSANTQHAQADPSQNVVIAPKAMDAVAVPTAPVHAAAQATTGADGKQHSADVPSSTLPATGEGLETAGSSGVNAAKLIQTLSETQMHVGMRSAEFGDISIRTAISQQQMVAQITVDHGDLGRAIAQHLPAAQSKLGDDLGLRAAIEVTQSGTGFSNERGNAQQDQRSFARPLEVAGVLSTAETQGLTPRTAVDAENADRLDIRA